MDFERARLEKARREARASIFVTAIRESSIPLQQITANDLVPLAIAIERCTPEEVALWVQRLLHANLDFE